MNETIDYALGRSALGPFLVAATQQGVCALSLGRARASLAAELRARFPTSRLRHAPTALEMLVDYVVGVVEDAADPRALALDLHGTPFQREVWEALREVPAGQTATYAELARQLGRRTAARAVAGACAANPVALLVPCHRIVRSDGSLSGYRWGVERKRALLEREAALRHVAATGRRPARLGCGRPPC